MPITVLYEDLQSLGSMALEAGRAGGFAQGRSQYYDHARGQQSQVMSDLMQRQTQREAIGAQGAQLEAGRAFEAQQAELDRAAQAQVAGQRLDQRQVEQSAAHEHDRQMQEMRGQQSLQELDIRGEQQDQRYDRQLDQTRQREEAQVEMARQRFSEAAIQQGMSQEQADQAWAEYQMQTFGRMVSPPGGSAGGGGPEELGPGQSLTGTLGKTAYRMAYDGNFAQLSAVLDNSATRARIGEEGIAQLHAGASAAFWEMSSEQGGVERLQQISASSGVPQEIRTLAQTVLSQVGKYGVNQRPRQAPAGGPGVVQPQQGGGDMQSQMQSIQQEIQQIRQMREQLQGGS